MKAKLVMLVIVVWSCQFAWAQDIQGVTIDTWPPFMYQQNGEMTGIAVDIVNTIFNDIDVSINITAYPWARAYNMALEERDVMLFPLFRTPEREALFTWIGPIIPSYDMYFFRLKDRSDIQLSSLEDAKAFHIGVIRNVANHKFLLSQGFRESDNLEMVTNPDQNIRMLFSGRIDLLISNEYTLPIQLKSLGLSYSSVEKVYSVLESNPGYMGFQKDTPKSTIDQVKAAFYKIKEQGEIDAILQEYLGLQQQL